MSKSAFIYTFSEVVNKVFPFILLPFMAGSLGVVDFGRLSIQEVYYSCFFVVFLLSVDVITLRTYKRYGRFLGRSVYISGIIYLISVSIISFGLLYQVSNDPIYLVVFLSSVISALLSMTLAMFQGESKPYHYLGIQFFALTLSSMVIFYYIYIDDFFVEDRFYALAFGYLIAILFFLPLYIKKWNFNFLRSLKLLFYLLPLSAPLLLHNFSFLLRNRFDRFFVEAYYLPEDLGIYSLATQLALVVPVGLLAVSKGVVPIFFGLLKRGSVNFKRIWLLCSIVSLTILCLSLFVYFFFDVFWGSSGQYHGVGEILAFSLVSYVLSPFYLVLINLIIYFGYTKYVAVVSILSSFIYTLLIYLFSYFIVPIKYLVLVNLLVTLLSIVFFYLYAIYNNSFGNTDEKNDKAV